MDLSSTTNIKTLKPKSKQQWKMVDKKLVATTVSSRIVGIRRRMEGMTTCSQDETKTHKEQEDEKVTGKGGSRQSLKHIDGDVPMWMYNKSKDVQLKSKKIERTRGEGGGGHLEGDVPMCMRNKAKKMKREQNKSQRAAATEQNVKVAAKRRKNVGSESKGASSSSSTEANKTTSETKKNGITFIVLQKNVRSLNSSERIEELTQEVEGCRWDAIINLCNVESKQLPRFGRRNKDTYSWRLENSRTNTELEFW